MWVFGAHPICKSMEGNDGTIFFLSLLVLVKLRLSCECLGQMGGTWLLIIWRLQLFFYAQNTDNVCITALDVFVRFLYERDWFYNKLRLVWHEWCFRRAPRTSRTKIFFSVLSEETLKATQHVRFNKMTWLLSTQLVCIIKKRTKSINCRSKTKTKCHRIWLCCCSSLT